MNCLREAEDLYEGAEGLWTRKDQIPLDPSEFFEEEYEKLLSPGRLEKINNGQQITEVELLLSQEVRLEKLLDDCGDADVTTGYSLAEVVDGEGNTGIAVFHCTGYSFFWLDSRSPRRCRLRLKDAPGRKTRQHLSRV